MIYTIIAYVHAILALLFYIGVFGLTKENWLYGSIALALSLLYNISSKMEKKG
jgi:hypothetical protein